MSIVQAATEFLPISSSGHLALVSHFISTPNLAFFVLLHLASLVAVLIFTRKEIWRLLHFKKQDRKYLIYLLVGIIPAGIFGLILKDFIEAQMNSLLFIGSAFVFSGAVILMTLGSKNKNKIQFRSSLLIGLAQVLALFPGVSRSGMTISSAKIMGIKGEDAFKFSFLMFIPLILGATLLEFGAITSFSLWMLIPFVVCVFASLFFLSILRKVVISNKFWMFSIYCFLIGILSFALWKFGY